MNLPILLKSGSGKPTKRENVELLRNSIIISLLSHMKGNLKSSRSKAIITYEPISFRSFNGSLMMSPTPLIIFSGSPVRLIGSLISGTGNSGSCGSGGNTGTITSVGFDPTLGVTARKLQNRYTDIDTDILVEFFSPKDECRSPELTILSSFFNFFFNAVSTYISG